MLVNVNVNEMGDLALAWSALKTLGYVLTFRSEKGKKTIAAVKFYICCAELEAKANFEWVKKALVYRKKMALAVRCRMSHVEFGN